MFLKNTICCLKQQCVWERYQEALYPGLVDPEPIRGTQGMTQEYILEGTLVHHGLYIFGRSEEPGEPSGEHVKLYTERNRSSRS